jgi:hypothetical protein
MSETVFCFPAQRSLDSAPLHNCLLDTHTDVVLFFVMSRPKRYGVALCEAEE